jgi:hypothetical protein
MGKISNFVSNHPIITGIVAYKVVDKIADKKSKQAVEEYKTKQQKQQQFESRQQEIIEEADKIQQRQAEPSSDEIVTANGKIIALPHISDDVDKIVNLYIIEHKSSRYIAQIFHTTRIIIKRILKENNVSIKNTIIKKLNWNSVKEIRLKCGKENVDSDTINQLAKEYKIHKWGITQVINNETWTDNNYTSIPVIHQTIFGGKSKLNFATVNKIREEYKSGDFVMAQLSQKFNITTAQISSIIRNKDWYDNQYSVPQDILNSRKNKKLTQDQELEIKQKRTTGAKLKELSAEYGISITSIGRILLRV